MVYFKELSSIGSIQKAIKDKDQVSKMRSDISEGCTYIVKQVIPKETIMKIRKYLTTIGQNSLPTYKEILPGCPNFHRVVN